MVKSRFLWVDDEIELLKPHILFLEEKGYITDCAGNGHDALDMCRLRNYDIVFLDEHMPGLSGLETLSRLNKIAPNVPVVMVTKSEDEGIMNQAIGKKISDYLIKPVRPSQILLSIKKLLEKKELVAESAVTRYGSAMGRLAHTIAEVDAADDWKSLYRDLVYWEIELEDGPMPIQEAVLSQKEEANRQFSLFIQRDYEQWILDSSNCPMMSHNLFEKTVFPLLDKGEKVFFILIDNFRLDQWYAIRDAINALFYCEEDVYYSILPTATPYSRNSIFSGLMPSMIEELYPEWWINEDDEEGKNQMEEELIASCLSRAAKGYSFSYHKVNSNKDGERLLDRFAEMRDKDFNVMVFNFMDMVSHARTDSKILQELVLDENAYRTLTRSWFIRSPLFRLLQKISDYDCRVIITSDHGSIRVKNPIKVVGDKETNSNPRYKLGKSLAYNPKKVYDVLYPKNVGLPSPNVSTRYIFARNNDFFVYPNQYNKYVSYYENSFQHGGISLEEMLVPIVLLTPK